MKSVANIDISMYVASSKHWSYESRAYAEILASGQTPGVRDPCEWYGSELGGL